ncbi:MAG: hypothetical protein VZR26_11520 [Erysipelotrichaceae bacterium]|nr:hypothetical protein [Erysipelotrichaceae bacterium]
MKMSKEADYGNWVPASMMKMLGDSVTDLCNNIHINLSVFKQ